jgi:PAS domain S-box-containing protein
MRYTLSFLAVLFSAWYGGFRAGVFSILISALAVDYYLIPPTHTLAPVEPRDQIDLLIFIVVGFGMVLLSHSQRRALERADQETALRRSAELAERAQRERFETTLASIGDAVIATDAEGRVTFMNDVAASLTGWEPAEASGLPLESVFSVVNEESRQPVVNPALQATQEGRTVGLANHTVLIARNGTEIPIDDSGAAIKDPDGRTVGAVLIFRDITERRRAELERSTGGRLVTQLAAIVESCDDAIVGKDLNLHITSWNRAAEQMFGYTASEAIGQSILFIVPKDRLSEEEEVVRRIRRGQKVEHLETERRRKDGTTIPVSLTISPIRDEFGTIVGASKIARDITERKRAVEAEREARRVAEEANRAKDDFLAMLSHELRNPLGAILGWTVILKNEPVLPGRVSHGLDVIERNVRLEAQLVESLLDLSRLAAGKFKLESDLVNLSTILANVVDSVQPSAEGKGLALSLTAPPEPVVLIGDSGRLQQVFSNLVGNAVKFTPTGGHV